MMRMPSPGPGNGWRQTIASGRPSSRPTRRTSSLNSARSGSTSENCRSSGRPPTLWCDLMLAVPVAATGLDDVGIERALHEEFDRLAVRPGGGDDVACRLLEDPDELTADRLALVLGVGEPGERVEEALGRVGHDELHAGRLDIVALDLLRLALAQQTVVDEHAGQLVTDRAVHQRRRDRGVDTAGQAADDTGRGRPARGSLRPARR